MKFVKWTALVTALFFFGSVLSGCGVPKKKYDALLTEKVMLEEKCDVLMRARDALKNEYDSLLKEKMDLATRAETVANEKKALKDEYDKLLEEKIALRAAYDKVLAESSELRAKLAQPQGPAVKQ